MLQGVTEQNGTKNILGTSVLSICNTYLLSLFCHSFTPTDNNLVIFARFHEKGFNRHVIFIQAEKAFGPILKRRGGKLQRGKSVSSTSRDNMVMRDYAAGLV